MLKNQSVQIILGLALVSFIISGLLYGIPKFIQLASSGKMDIPEWNRVLGAYTLNGSEIISILAVMVALYIAIALVKENKLNKRESKHRDDIYKFLIVLFIFFSVYSWFCLFFYQNKNLPDGQSQNSSIIIYIFCAFISSVIAGAPSGDKSGFEEKLKKNKEHQERYQNEILINFRSLLDLINSGNQGVDKKYFIKNVNKKMMYERIFSFRFAVRRFLFSVLIIIFVTSISLVCSAVWVYTKEDLFLYPVFMFSFINIFISLYYLYYKRQGFINQTLGDGNFFNASTFYIISSILGIIYLSITYVVEFNVLSIFFDDSVSLIICFIIFVLKILSFIILGVECRKVYSDQKLNLYLNIIVFMRALGSAWNEERSLNTRIKDFEIENP